MNAIYRAMQDGITSCTTPELEDFSELFARNLLEQADDSINKTDSPDQV